MNVQQVTSDEANRVSEDARLLRARIELLVQTLPNAVWFNPSLAVLWTLPFTGLFPMFGTIAWSHIAIILGFLIGNSLAAQLIIHGYQRDPGDPNRWIWLLSAHQAATGIAWGVFVWLVWVEGNSLNNVLVATTVNGIIWAYAFSRAMAPAGVYLAGLAPTAILAIARLAFSGGHLAFALAFMTTMTFCLVYMMAYRARRQVQSSLRTRFANEDLTHELRSTRDDALRKRFEAEAANASKTTFLANMSHELRTPLNAILGFSELISNETLGPVGTARYCDYARDINSSGAHLLSLINDILDIAKIESGKMEIVPTIIDPRAAVEDALSVVEGRAQEKHHTLTYNIANGVDELYSDERAFRQIIINLLSNAVKFTPDGGRIEVSLRRSADGSGSELCVSDNGPGIAAVLLDQIFMPFNQVDNRYSRQAGGTGLGLSLVRGLAELHGGRAWIDSDVGKGVRAHVYLPGLKREATKQRRAMPV